MEIHVVRFLEPKNGLNCPYVYYCHCVDWTASVKMLTKLVFQARIDSQRVILDNFEN